MSDKGGEGFSFVTRPSLSQRVPRVKAAAPVIAALRGATGVPVNVDRLAELSGPAVQVGTGVSLPVEQDMLQSGPRSKRLLVLLQFRESDHHLRVSSDEGKEENCP